MTERGKPVARIVPVSGAGNLKRLIADGVVRAPRRIAEPAGTRDRIKVRSSVSDLVIDQRRR